MFRALLVSVICGLSVHAFAEHARESLGSGSSRGVISLRDSGRSAHPTAPSLGRKAYGYGAPVAGGSFGTLPVYTYGNSNAVYVPPNAVVTPPTTTGAPQYYPYATNLNPYGAPYYPTTGTSYYPSGPYWNFYPTGMNPFYSSSSYPTTLPSYGTGYPSYGSSYYPSYGSSYKPCGGGGYGGCNGSCGGSCGGGYNLGCNTNLWAASATTPPPMAYYVTYPGQPGYPGYPGYPSTCGTAPAPCSGQPYPTPYKYY